jgi:methionine aminopeptidase
MAKPGGSSAELQEAVNSVADAFGVNVYSGSTLHQVKRFVPDATKKVSLSSHHEAAKSEKCEFEAGEVYAIDLAVTTGEGKQKDGKHRTTVFRRRVETKYALKNKASRVLLNEINDMCPSLCFSMRMFKDEAAAKMGIRELDAHALVEPYKVMYEEKDAQVIHVKYTILLLPSGNIKVTGLPLPANINSEKVGNLPAAITELLASTSLEKKKKVRSKKKKTG